jgi:translocation and assembly module TamB
MKRLARWIGWSLLVAFLMLLAFSVWLFRSESGLAFLLHRGLGAADGNIEYTALRGSLAGGFEIDTPQFELPGIRISAVQLAMQVKTSRLLRGEVQVAALRLAGARYTLLPGDDQPAQPMQRPGVIDLPIALVLRNLDLVANEIDLGGEQPLVFSVAATEIALRDGSISIDGLALRQGEFAVRARAAVDTASDWSGEFASEGEWTLPAVLHRAQLRMAGDLDALAVELALDGGGELRVDADLRQPLGKLGIQGTLGASDIDLASFGVEAPVRRLDLELAVDWTDGKLGVSGPVTVDGRRIELTLQGLEFLEHRLRVQTLALGSPEIGRLSLSGEWPTDPSAAPGAIQGQMENLFAGDWRAAPPEPAPRISAALTASGHSEAWQLALGGSWARGAQAGPLRLSLAGTPERIDVAPSQIGLAQSLIDLSGAIALGERTGLGFDLKASGIDPALLLADWPGNLGGQMRIDATLGERADWTLAIADLSGELRAAPLALTGKLHGSDAQPQGGRVELRWADGSATLEVPEADAIALALQDFDLARLGPWQGRVSGRIDTRLDADPVAATSALLEIDDLAIDGIAASQLRIGKQPGWSLDLASDELDAGGSQFKPLRLTISGSEAAHRIELGTREARGRVELALSGSRQGDLWSGALERLELTPARGAPWTLSDTAALAIGPTQQSLGQACLQAAAARACISGRRDETQSVVSIALDGLPLKELQAWAEPGDWSVDGQLSGGGELTLDAAGTPGGALRFDIQDGQLRGAEGLDMPLAFNGQLGFDGATAALDAAIELPGHGRVDASARGFDQPDGEFSAKLAITDLSFVDGLSAEVQGMRGGLSGEISAPLADPVRVRGLLEGKDLAFELPALGLKASESTLGVLLEGDGLVRVDGAFAIAPGHVRIDGLVGLGDSDVSEVRIRADNAGFVDLPAVRLAGDANFLVKRGADGFAIAGGILLRQGKIDLDRFQPAFPASEDVVIEDAPPPPPPLPISAEVSIALIQAVDLRGYGIEATLNGGVHLIQRPGKLPRATGEMLIGGIYNAYGQKLDIERGRLGFGGGRADNPSLDILAVKRVDRQRVGVQVRGNARRPAIRLYSDPALDQSETLSYLVLGRPLATASGADSEQLGEYASALETAGGSLVAGSIGKKLGLAAGVESFGSAIGSALVVGKYLSPRFFIGYGTSLLDATQLVILRYRLTEHIELEGISGAEQKASASWRTER